MPRSQSGAGPAIAVAGTPRCELGESPCWDAVGRRLLWVDLLAGLVHVLDASGETRTVAIGRPVSAVVADDDGWLLAVETGVERRDRDLKLRDVLDLLPRPTLVRMNDAARDSAGRLWVGTLAYDDRPGVGRLYRLDPNDRVAVMADGLGISNGIAWSADERRMFHVDSLARVVWVRDHDPASGAIGPPSAWYRPDGRPGLPDGIALDREGCLWVALWGGAAVVRVDPDGRVVDEVALPALHVSSVAFGDEHLHTLFVTTATHDLDAAALERYPGSGWLHRIEVPVAGLPVGPS